MRTVFADTGYWIATLDIEDALHSKASSVSAALRPLHIVTTELILVELLNAMSNRGAHFRRKVVEYIEGIFQNPNILVVPQSSELFQRAFTLYKEREDKNWSAVDCASFIIMLDLGLTKALAYDRHFEQAGFQALLR